MLKRQTRLLAGREVKKRNKVKFIFGLGNPGSQYKNNRHNIGYRVVEKIAEEDKRSFKRKFGLGGLIATGQAPEGTEGYLLGKPNTFMNNSGLCLKKAFKKYGFSLKDILVVYDDADLALGTLKFKRDGSSAGHRGMQSIIESLGTEEISRLRIGIGKEPERDTADYVLSDFLDSELEILQGVIIQAAEACRSWVTQGLEKAMLQYNRKLTS